MDKWLGVGVVLFVLLLSFLARKRSCSGCSSCQSGCRRSSQAEPDAAHEEVASSQGTAINGSR